MKCIAKIAAGIISAALLVFGTAGCKQDSDSHEHIFSTAWTSDGTNHWHAATCEHTAEVSGKAAHTFGEYASDGNATTTADGTKSRTCSVCSYKDTMADEGSKIIVPECVKVTGATVTGAVYTDNFDGVFPYGRTVTLSSFYMGKYEVTQAQYKSVMAGQKVTVSGTEYTLAASPSYCTGSNEECKIDFGKDHANYPVECVTWYDALYYCNALSVKENLDPCYTIDVRRVEDGHIKYAQITYDKTKKGYRLPTEAEWEYAARGGDTTAADWNYTFSGADKAAGSSYNYVKNSGLDSVGWYRYNNITGATGDSDVTNSAEGRGTHEVGKKNANALGIYDMSGNVYEWCSDSLISRVETGNFNDPAVGVSSYFNKVFRGGGWAGPATSVSYRPISTPRAPENIFTDVGFRVCRYSSE